ncbi:winged helix-turn-helix transcriptional regulator [candidate division KSB1 bacterium]|nr:winged helix-turn-helix transcriptional regulator [candidate division KSB1 bacterium]
MLEALIGSKVREQILVYLTGRQEGYAREIAAYYQSSLSPFQIQLERLENGNILVGKNSGKTRIYTFNPRYPFLNELKKLLEKTITFLPVKEQENLLIVRKRPRRKNKSL